MDFRNLKFPKEEAESYLEPEKRMEFNRLFYQDSNYTKIQDPTTYFIIGDKGSGKTAYSVYYCNNMINNILSKRYNVVVEDYYKIIQMKDEGKLQYTHYITLWKAALLLKIISSIKEAEISALGGTTYKKIQDYLQKYNFTSITEDSFSPISFLDNREMLNLIVGEVGETRLIKSQISGKIEQKETMGLERKSSVYYDIWTSFINEMVAYIERLRLKNSHYLFVDGIDSRPPDIDPKDYQRCVYPLVRAVYEINHDIFSRIKDRKKGRLKIVLLTRLDIFMLSGLPNPDCKLNDNSVFLNWGITSEHDYQSSAIFSLVNKLIQVANPEPPSTFEDSWKTYFGFKIAQKDSFEYLLRRTASRPRDFVKILLTANELCKRKRITSPNKDILVSDEFMRAFSSYYVGMIKTGLKFYYNDNEINELWSFLKSIKKRIVTYKELKDVYQGMLNYEKLQNNFGDLDKILSLMFDNNMIGYIESDRVYRWKYKEISEADFNYSLPPEALLDNARLQFHPALEKEFGLYLGEVKIHKQTKQ